MAERKSTVEARSRRASRAPPGAPRTALRAAIATERRRLQRADSLLSCIAVALDHEASTARPIDYADAVDFARSIVNETVCRLDEVTLRRLHSQE